MQTLPDILSIRSRARPERWEDAMVGGNGAVGFMAMGGAHEECLILCHEKCWTERCDVERRVTSIRKGLQEARPLALAGRFKEAHEVICKRGIEEFRRQYNGREFDGGPGFPCRDQLPCNTAHPALHLLMSSKAQPVSDYGRETILDTGEVVTSWKDAGGRWERRAFASRTDNAIVVRFRGLDGQRVDNCALRFARPPALQDADVKAVTIRHRAGEMYFHCVYSRSAGKPVADGYHVMGRVFAVGGTAQGQADSILVHGASEVLVLVRIEFLDEAAEPRPDRLRAGLPGAADYDALLKSHAAVHGEMLNRVRLDLGAGFGEGRYTEDILAEAEEEGATAAFLELMHAMGRYLFISSSGELPPALMGIWSNAEEPAWGGRYTTDSNLNLAVAAGSQGNMHEAMESYFSFVERMLPDWRENARTMFGCRGFTPPLVQDWRSGRVAWYMYMWTGAAGWLCSYFYDHYLYTQDKDFLRQRVVPLLMEIADLYQDLASAMPETEEGKHIFYPGLSPENAAANHDRACNFPNASMDLAICKQALANLIAACRELAIHGDLIPKWEAMLAKVADYRLLDDGALAEWSWPGVEPREEHRHTSHLYCVYPGMEVSPRKTPGLAKAARLAIRRRIKGGRATSQAHALLHHLFFAAHLLDGNIYWQFMDAFARDKFMNSSMVSNHNPNLEIYNLDASLAMPGAIMEMIMHSEPGFIHLLPVASERLGRGQITGILARGGITVRRLAWDLDAGVIRGVLTSKRSQAVKVLGPKGFRGATADAWSELGELELKAGEPCGFEYRNQEA